MGYEAPEIDGWMSTGALEWLYETAQKMNSIVEIGCWKGKSTHALLSGCKGPVFAVDHFKGNPEERTSAHKEAALCDIGEQFKKNVGHFKNLVLMRMESTEAAKYFALDSVDMVFIDGSHEVEAVMADVAAWLPKCRRLMCGHDSGYSGVQGALDNLGLVHKDDKPGGIWVIGYRKGG